MENTLENKAKFFALYWGQEIVGWNFSTGAHLSRRLTVDDIRLNSNQKEFFLELKPLSSMIDEDAIHLAELMDIVDLSSEDVIPFIHKCTDKYQETSRGMDLVFSDYLRSRGYALPWMGLSVEELINRGWVKLKEALSND